MTPSQPTRRAANVAGAPQVRVRVRVRVRRHPARLRGMLRMRRGLHRQGLGFRVRSNVRRIVRKVVRDNR